ncbi:MAG TPA: methionyl-tRNA formyltransferase [Candidatus Eisenbacteria bacterium]
MRVVFMGTPVFSVPCLVAMVEAGHTVPLVVTQPDRPKGRGRELSPTPVKQAALDRNIAVFQPERPNRDDAVATIEAARPDVLVVVAYGAILKARLLGLAPKGAVNVHASLLPRHRGMSPIHRAILDGDEETGITTMFMDEGVDTGDMILIETTPIAPNETTGQLHDRLAQMGARLLVDTLARIEAGTAPRTPQPPLGASYAGRIDKIDGVIDWSRNAAQVHNRIRAMTPAPGATGSLEGQPLLVAGSLLVDESVQDAIPHGDTTRTPGGEPAIPGTVLAVMRDALRVATGQGAIDIHEVRPAGGRTMSASAYARGRGIAPGSRFYAPPASPGAPGAAR